MIKRDYQVISCIQIILAVIMLILAIINVFPTGIVFCCILTASQILFLMTNSVKYLIVATIVLGIGAFFSYPVTAAILSVYTLVKMIREPNTLQQCSENVLFQNVNSGSNIWTIVFCVILMACSIIISITYDPYSYYEDTTGLYEISNQQAVILFRLSMAITIAAVILTIVGGVTKKAKFILCSVFLYVVFMVLRLICIQESLWTSIQILVYYDFPAIYMLTLCYRTFR